MRLFQRLALDKNQLTILPHLRPREVYLILLSTFIFHFMIHYYQRIFTLLLLLSCFSGLLNAHAVVTEHSIKIDAIHAHQTSQVKLTFNSGIELGLSQVFLVRKGDIEEKLPVKMGQSAGDVLIDMPALVEGEYALYYKIFAADGHITDDIIHFTVQP